MRKTYYNDFKDSLVLQSSINYDLQGRKTSSTVQINNNNPITTDSLQYNELGQLKNKSLHQQNNNVLENIAYTYNPRGWQLSASGSMVSDGEVTIKYYENGMPKEISKGSDLTYYVYDALGTKLFSNYLKDSTQFYVDGIEFRGRRNPKPYYIAFEDGYIDSSLQFNYYLKDHLGNIRKVINSTTSTVTQTTDYYPFGLAISTTGSSNNKYLYNGKEIQSGSGFYDYGARMYDARVGRWFVVDALAEERDWLSTYNYCQNNPMSRIDPDGKLDGDYYDREGNYLGNDGVDDNKVYKLNDNYRIIYNFPIVNWGGTLNFQITEIIKSVSKYLGKIEESFVTGDVISDKRIQSLHPALRMKATDFINEANISSNGKLIRVAEGFRTYEQQDALYAQGRTTLGNIVTDAKGGFSNHNYGLAFDIVGITNGQLDYDLDWKQLSTLAKSKGFEWGGDWKKFKDKPHFQNMFGKSLDELRLLPKNKDGLPILKD